MGPGASLTLSEYQGFLLREDSPRRGEMSPKATERGWARGGAQRRMRCMPPPKPRVILNREAVKDPVVRRLCFCLRDPSSLRLLALPQLPFAGLLHDGPQRGAAAEIPDAFLCHRQWRPAILRMTHIFSDDTCFSCREGYFPPDMHIHGMGVKTCHTRKSKKSSSGPTV